MQEFLGYRQFCSRCDRVICGVYFVVIDAILVTSQADKARAVYFSFLISLITFFPFQFKHHPIDNVQKIKKLKHAWNTIFRICCFQMKFCYDSQPKYKYADECTECSPCVLLYSSNESVFSFMFYAPSEIKRMHSVKTRNTEKKNETIYHVNVKTKKAISVTHRTNKTMSKRLIRMYECSLLTEKFENEIMEINRINRKERKMSNE